MTCYIEQPRHRIAMGPAKIRQIFCCTVEGSVDRGWAWFLLFNSVLLNVCSGIQWTAFSVFYDEFCQYFDASKFEVGWIESIYVIMTYTSPILASGFLVRYDLNAIAICGCGLMTVGFVLGSQATQVFHLYLTYGFLGGIGFGILDIGSATIPQFWFDRWRPFAAGVSLCGFSVGMLISPPLIRLMINEYSFRGALILLGGIQLQGVVFSALLKKPPWLNQPKTSSSPSIKKIFKEVANLSVFKEVTFCLFGLSFFLRSFGWSVFWKHFINRAIFLGVDSNTAPFLLSLTSLSITIWRIPTCIIANVKGVNRLFYFAVGVVGMGLANCLMLTTSSFYGMAVLACMYGVFHTTHYTNQMTVITDIFGVERLTKVYSLVNIFRGVGCFIATPLAGLIFDKTLNYDLPFGILGSIQMCGGFILCSIGIKHCRSQKHKQDNQEEIWDEKKGFNSKDDVLISHEVKLDSSNC